MIIRPIKENEITKFIDFADSIYSNDINYVPFMRLDLKKTLKRIVFEKQKYVALCSFDDNNKITGRIIVTIKPNKQLNTNHCGYFSLVEFVNDYDIFSALIDRAIEELKKSGAEYIVGSFFPHDPDNRRGILVKGFELAPMIFTSHNPEYYPLFFERYGFDKLTDAYEYEYSEKPEIIEKIKETAQKSLAENNIYISKVDFSHLKREIEDIHTIMEIASTQINFEKVLSIEELTKIVNSWKRFIDPDFAFIARKKIDNSPVGFTLSIPDYFELIRKMKGRLNLKGIFIYLTQKKKISGLRAILQYIIPEYQHKGISKALYNETRRSVEERGINRISLGTIMEANDNSNGAIKSLGGELSRVYRIYYKKI